MEHLHNFSKKRKRPFTLLEIMIVIFLIGLIGSVIGFNMKGSLEEGKAFKTQQAMQQVEDALTMLLAEDAITVTEINSNFVACLEKSNLLKSPEALAKDGWNVPFAVTADEKTGAIQVQSLKYEAYLVKQESKKQNNTNQPVLKDDKSKNKKTGKTG